MLLLFFFICLSVCCSDQMISIILSFRSLICSSILFTLLFIAFSSVFILAIELSSFDWLLFKVFSSLLQWSAFLLIAFLNSFSIFITYFLPSGSGRLERSVSLFVLSGDFSCSFNWEWYLCFFILLIFLWLYEFTYCVLEGVGVSLCNLHESYIFGVKTVSSMDAFHIFPQCVLSVVSFIGGLIGIVVTTACPGCWVGPPLCSVVVTALLGAGSAPYLLKY